MPHKCVYNVRFAQREYEELRSFSKEGGILSRWQETLQMNSVAAPLIAQRQFLYVIVAKHPKLEISVKELYNYIDQGVLLIRNINLKHKVKFKP